MGLLNNVIKRTDNVAVAGEDKKLLVNINSRIEDLKLQNMENAKFLRGLSRKIEAELEQLREAEINKSIEVKDDSEIISSIERVEKALEEINNNDVIEEIDRINKTLEESVTRIDSSVSKIDTEQLSGIIETVDKLEVKVDELSTAISETSSKVNSIVTMPGNVQRLMETQGNELTDRLEEMIHDMGASLEEKNSSVKKMVGFNLWLTFLNVALLIAYILGFLGN